MPGRSSPRASARAAVRILGIDPGTLRLGYGVVECAAGGAALGYVECGVISAPARDARAVRLGEIGRGLRELITEVRPDVVAMEEAFYGVNVQSTLALGEARGVALFVASEHGLTVTGYPPATVKKAVVGHGRASKEQIGFLVRALLSMRSTPAPDAADALAIAICHARSRNFGDPGRVPAPSRDGLRSAKPSFARSNFGDPGRVPAPPRDGLRSAKPSFAHAIGRLGRTR